MAECYQKAKLFRDTLVVVGKPLSSSEFITYFLACLGSDFDSMVTSITTHVDPLSLSQVYSHLLTHESKFSHQLIHLIATIEFSTNTTYKPPINNHNRSHEFYCGRGGYQGHGCGRNGGHLPLPIFLPSILLAKFVLNKVILPSLIIIDSTKVSNQLHPLFRPTSPLSQRPPLLSPHLADNVWYLDSIVIHHFTHDFSNLSLSPTKYKGDKQVCIDDSTIAHLFQFIMLVAPLCPIILANFFPQNLIMFISFLRI